MPQWAAFYKIKPDKMKNLPVIQRILILRQEVFQIRTIRRGSMVKLLIIADDFTGALDTGVQFAARGAATRVITDPAFAFAGARPAGTGAGRRDPARSSGAGLRSGAADYGACAGGECGMYLQKDRFGAAGQYRGRVGCRNGCGRRRSAPLYPCVPQDPSHDKGWSPFDRRGAGGAERVRAGPL